MSRPEDIRKSAQWTMNKEAKDAKQQNKKVPYYTLKCNHCGMGHTTWARACRNCDRFMDQPIYWPRPEERSSGGRAGRWRREGAPRRDASATPSAGAPRREKEKRKQRWACACYDGSKRKTHPHNEEGCRVCGKGKPMAHTEQPVATDPHQEASQAAGEGSPDDAEQQQQLRKHIKDLKDELAGDQTHHGQTTRPDLKET